MIVWGTISAATAACTNYAGLIAIRFFLGFVEAAYFPGCTSIRKAFHKVVKKRILTYHYDRPLLPVMLVHPKGAVIQVRSFVQRSIDLGSVFRSDRSWRQRQHGWSKGSASVEVAVHHRGCRHDLHRFRRVLRPPQLSPNNLVAHRGRATARCMAIGGGYRRGRLGEQ